MTEWRPLLKNGTQFVWSQGTGPRAPALIATTSPASGAGARPLDSLLRQLDLDEWSPVTGTPGA